MEAVSNFVLLNYVVTHNFMHKAFSVFQIISLGWIPRVGIIGSKYVIIIELLTHLATLLSKSHVYLQSMIVTIYHTLLYLSALIKRYAN